MWKQSLLVILISLIVYWALSTCIRFGVFRVVYNHAPGDCFRVPRMENGSEDIEVLPNGLAFISTGLKFPGTTHDDAGVGDIYLFDFNHPDAAPVALQIVGEERYKTLNPHGISLWTDSRMGDVYLYVINHTPDGEAVDRFKFNADQITLQHVKRFDKDDNFHRLNDLVVVDEDQFYYTNCIYVSTFLEMFFRLRWGSIGFYDGRRSTIVEQGSLNFPNGITVSKDGRSLYLAHTGDQEVRVYGRNDDNSLTLHRSVALGTNVDNLDVDLETGDVWLGAQPVFYKGMAYMQNPIVNFAPSQVLKIRLSSSGSGSSPTVEEVYSNDGSQISGSSVAVRYKAAFLIGSMRSHMVYCKIN